jgi:hypothetical protein
MVATNNRRVTTAHARIRSAIEHLEFMLEMHKTKTKYTDGKGIILSRHAQWTIKRVIYDLKNAKTILEGTTFKNKDKYGRLMQ